jgi:RND family efflux transporter MFP subunit
LGHPALIASAVLVAGLFSGCKPPPKAAAPTSVKVVRRDVTGLILLNGEAVVPPNSRADILPPYRTIVSKVYSGVGQSVRKGEVLLELSPPSVQASYEQNRQAVKAAETALKNADAQYSQAVNDALKRLEQARLNEQKARQTAQQNIVKNETAPDDVNAAASAADTGLTLQQATADRVAAEAALQQARQAKEAGTAPYEQQLAAAKAAFGGAQGARKASAVKAPISGEVLLFNAQQNAEIGQNANAPIVTIVDLSDVTVHASVTPAQSSYVKKGTPVTMTFAQAPGQTFSGEVTDLDTPAESASQSYVAIIGFKNDKGRVKPGMKASVSAKIGEAKNALAVPNDAVDHDSNGKTIVNVMRNNEWVPVVVEVGLSDASFTEIKTGLEEGETVQVTPDIK